MNLHEYQAKRLFQDYTIPVSDGRTATTVGEALSAARELGGSEWMVKAQVHAGGRGKAGGVRKCNGLEQLEAAANSLLGSRLVTAQTTALGQPVNRLLIERPCQIDHEYYLAALVERKHGRIVFMASAAGGMEIERIAAEQPERLIRIIVDPVVGLQPYQCRRVAFALGLDGARIGGLTRIMLGLYRLLQEKDAELVEINPLVTTETGELLALDGKLSADDNALFRHADINDLRDPTQEDDKENHARQHGLNYITLDGNIACMVNGAGLAMATMDLIKLHGGEPANFLDVGGGTTTEKVAEAFKLILSDDKVRAILVNIFGGIVRCDLIAEGIIQAVAEVGVSLPVVVRLEGTNAEAGLALLAESGLDILTASGLTDAAEKAVAAAGRG